MLGWREGDIHTAGLHATSSVNMPPKLPPQRKQHAWKALHQAAWPGPAPAASAASAHAQPHEHFMSVLLDVTGVMGGASLCPGA